MGMLGKLLPQLVVLSLPLLLLVQLSVPDLDDGLEVLPGLLQGLHGEPGVGVGSHVEALDLLVQLGQGLKVGRGRRKALQELTVSLLQAEDLLQRVAPVRDKARKVRKLALLVFWASF